MPNETWVFWLNITNLVLGIVVILAALAVGSSASGAQRKRKEVTAGM
jgi:hypothetical protein